jgi:hypothetical protein
LAPGFPSAEEGSFGATIPHGAAVGPGSHHWRLKIGHMLTDPGRAIATSTFGRLARLYVRRQAFGVVAEAPLYRATMRRGR